MSLQEKKTTNENRHQNDIQLKHSNKQCNNYEVQRWCINTSNSAVSSRVGKKPAFIRIVQAAGFYRL